MPRLPLFALAFLIGCSHPLDEGAYDVTLTDMPSNGCNFDEASLGGGTTIAVEASWSGDELYLDGFGPPDDGWAWDGADGIARTWTQTTSEADDCDLVTTFDMQGTITSQASFTVDGELTMVTDGACTEVDPAFTSCTAEVVYDGVKSGK